MEIISFKPVERGGRIPREPKRQTEGAAACDLHAFLEEDITIEPLGRALVPTGLCVSVPCGYAGLVFARSGLAARQGLALANGVGLIDSDYRGELMVALVNLSGQSAVVRDGDRVAQFMLCPAPAFRFERADELEETRRGQGGFGSTGVAERD